MSDPLSINYDHKAHEEDLYKKWQEAGFFNPDNLPVSKSSKLKAKSFTIIMPPPNANGPLHIGHALFVTLQDIMIRYQRMQGKKTLWLPGADHAGFETQVVYDKKLEKEGRNRFEMLKTEQGRKQLYDEIYAFTQENKKVMEGQLRKLGASCDWSRERFTLEPKIIETVYETFEKLYKDGLIYRDLKVVNWCPKHQTALSDLEVKYEERLDPLYYIKYGPLTLATVRPETKFGDTGLAVNPKDKRYKQYIGKEIEAQGLLGPLKFKVIADEAIDPDFGTGVVKVTPAHDPADFEIWQRHKDEIPGIKQVIDERGRLTQLTGPYAGLKVAEARQKVAEDMQKAGLLEKVDSTYKHQVATCYKCGNVLEPLPKLQWFVAMTKKPVTSDKRQATRKSLRDMAVKAVKSKKIKFVTKKFEKVFYNWMANIRDWNISRQIVWGIRIPVWYRGEEIYVGKEAPKESGWVQDPDVFDTWFSSGQWPFAALLATSDQKQGTRDFKEFYPTQVMETGYDILFFWVARMIMLGLYATGKPPFETIYMHGLVRDKERQKMSKSKGNVIDPLGVADTYGTDAVRMALVIGNAAGTDPVVSEDKIRGYRNFATKIWNASRFVLMNYKASSVKPKYTVEDKKNLKELAAIQKKVTKSLDGYDFNTAGSTLYHYFWHTFADKIIEASKKRLSGADEGDRLAAQETLLMILTTSLVMLHPFMPFVTEAIYQKLPIENKGMLIVHSWK